MPHVCAAALPPNVWEHQRALHAARCCTLYIQTVRCRIMPEAVVVLLLSVTTQHDVKGVCYPGPGLCCHAAYSITRFHMRVTLCLHKPVPHSSGACIFSAHPHSLHPAAHRSHSCPLHTHVLTHITCVHVDAITPADNTDPHTSAHTSCLLRCQCRRLNCVDSRNLKRMCSFKNSNRGT